MYGLLFNYYIIIGKEEFAKKKKNEQYDLKECKHCGVRKFSKMDPFICGTCFDLVKEGLL